ncbi:2Fe-2S iron-sulfur cluster-binding protein [Pseudomonas sp.]|jgi:NAD(P)H-flavin reductase|uniref:2Fe-2S iron-sulfur cluster-binding protein n=1 Tax=Pseudomonas sp. TaxID=306 RepID=UPI00272A71A2|nr:2Fe-2S iron-sulfur cluster-binding protein [Pseudomonas sp.]
MPEIRLGAERLQVSEGVNLLQALLDAGHTIAHSCRAGACQACMLKARPDQIPPVAAAALTNVMRDQGYLLSCQCPVLQDMDVELIDPATTGIPGSIHSTELLEPDLLRLRIRPARPVRHKAGQHVLIWLDAQLARPYSLASQPGAELMEFHIRLRTNGRFSEAIKQLSPGATLQLGQVAGGLGYDLDWHDRPLILLAAGTGLAPLQAVARHALDQGHAAPIQLWHWSTQGKCYLGQELQALADQHSSLSFQQRALTTLEADLGQLRLASRTTMALVCGSPDFTERLRKPLFMAGLPGRQVISEAFVSGTRPSAP